VKPKKPKITFKSQRFNGTTDLLLVKSSLVFHLRSSRLQTFSIDFLRLCGNSLKVLKYTHPFSLWNCLNALNLFIRLYETSPFWQVLGWQTRHQYKRLWFFMLETLVSHAETAELIEMSSGRFWRPKESQIPSQKEILGVIVWHAQTPRGQYSQPYSQDGSSNAASVYHYCSNLFI